MSRTSKKKSRAKQVAALESKQNKSPNEVEQLSNLLKKQAVVASQGPKQRSPMRPVVQAKPRRFQAFPGAFVPGGQLTPQMYKSLLMENGKRCASTAPGEAFYHKALHPPSAIEAPFAGLPDFTSQPRAVPNFTTNAKIVWDAGMFATAPDAPTTFGIRMYVPDIPEIAFFYRLIDEKNDATSKIRVVRTSTMDTTLDADFNTFNALENLGFSSARVTTSSVTGVYGGTTLGDAGVVYAGSFTPNYRCIMAGTNSPITTVGNVIGSGATTVHKYDCLAGIKAMMQADPQHGRGRARDGFFCVQKFDESLMGYQYSDSGDGNWYATNPAGTNIYFGDVLELTFSDSINANEGLLSSVVFTTDSAIKVKSGYTIGSNLVSAAQWHGGVTQHSGMAWTGVFIDGLSISQNEYFAIERIMTIDAQVPFNSVMTPFTRQVPDWDELAIKSVMKFHRMMPSYMPADCNGFMDWVRGIFGWLGKNGRPLIDVVKALPIPGAAVAGDIAENVIPMINGALSGSSV